jgi:hypothetical protein
VYLQKNSKIIYLPAFLQGFLPGFSFAGLLAKAGIIQTFFPIGSFFVRDPAMRRSASHCMTRWRET